ncbi:hypothetical protein J7355_11255 [Endozoicomonas sp. G2_2]|uniref:hypothetical protein n=1 Tax=Endozoicomonas sp. G2_2 TaxID=2821092 RepID=UPI001ADA7BA1|nr:hypothetical protein [Endozoicomonas sp. G2_2]MBO9470678.1 hypothetical protein [Endozoicomonas sp. G2_2]
MKGDMDLAGLAPAETGHSNAKPLAQRKNRIAKPSRGMACTGEGMDDAMQQT